MIKKGTGYKPSAISLLLRYVPLAVVAIAAPPAFAQDALPETPPELRDFKLEPVPSRPARPPRDEPLIVPREEQSAPTRAAPVLRPAGPASAPFETTPAPVTAAPRTTTRPTAAANSQAGAATTPSPRETDFPDVAETSDSGDEPIITEPVPPSTPETLPADRLPELSAGEPSREFPYWWLIAALAVVAAIFFGVRRALSGKKEDDAPQMDADPIAPVTPVIPEQKPVASPKMHTPLKADTAPAILEISFAPSTATLSINNLIIKGTVLISNQDNDEAVRDMRLRLIVISASEIQDEVIEAFHSDPDHRYVEKLGDAKAGEQITMDVTLSVPLSEIQSYQLGTKQLFAPIVVANVIYGSGAQGTHYEARLACMIGREANPPTAKMGALRMDLGPRSFGALGQRPLFG